MLFRFSELCKPARLLHQFAWIYSILGVLLIIVNIAGIPITSIDAILFVGFVLAAVQTYALAMIVNCVALKKSNPTTSNTTTHIRR